MSVLITAFLTATAYLAMTIGVLAQPSDVEKADRQAEEAYYARNYRRATELALHVLESRRREFGAYHHSLTSPLSILGGSAELLADYPAAERYRRELLEAYEKVYGRDSINAAFGMESLARVLIKLGHVDEAEQLYQRVVAAREKMTRASGVGLFRARHIQNSARIALARTQWKRAFDEFRESFRQLASDAGSQPMSNDYLPDLANEMNAANFLGLARAAWHLGQRPGEKPEALFEETFKIVQLKWWTAAAAALMKAAQRRDDTTGATASEQSEEERLRSLRAEQEDNLHAWFAKREQDPVYHELSKRQMEANIALSSGPMMDNFAATTEAANRQIAIYKRCGSNFTAACQKEIDKIEAEKAELNKASAKEVAALSAIDQRLHAREKEIEGYQAFQQRRIDLDIRTSQLAAKIGSSKRPRKTTTRAAPLRFGEGHVLSVARIRELLAPNEALLTYLVDDENGYVWAITRETTRWAPVRLEGEVASERVAALRCGLDAAAWQGADGERRCQNLLGVKFTQADAQSGAPLPFDLSRAHGLYKALFGELEPLLKDKQLIVVSSGPLASLPLATLVTVAPETALPPLAGYRKAAWLGIRQVVTVLPSVASLAALRSGASPSQARDAFIGWGNPTLVGTPDCPPVELPTVCPGANTSTADHAALRSRKAVASGRDLLRSGLANVDSLRRACPLPDTAHELQCVARSLNAPESTVHIGPAATEEAVKSARLDHYRIIHFATHGLLARETGSFSSGLPEPALLMTPPVRATKRDDGLLTASEIAQLKLDADWVILSACNTAAAGNAQSEMLSGLARGFFYAGARAVLVSQWAVDSDAAVKLTSGSFARLARSGKIGRGEAMRQSMAALVENGAPYEAHPSYWAPFMIVGEGGR